MSVWFWCWADIYYQNAEMQSTSSKVVLYTVLKLFWMEFSFKAYMPNLGCLPFVISALYCPGPATPISLRLTWSERESSTAEPCSNRRNLDFQYTQITINHVCCTHFHNPSTFPCCRAQWEDANFSCPVDNLQGMCHSAVIPFSFKLNTAQNARVSKLCRNHAKNSLSNTFGKLILNVSFVIL